MAALGLLIALVGALFVDSALRNTSPKDTLLSLIKNPQQAKQTLTVKGATYNTSGDVGIAVNAADITGTTGSGAASVPGSGTAATVVAAARAQIGKPYKYGYAGPDSFDCSGLVVYAFKQAGISLPHFTGALAVKGNAVTKSALQPGDLVFPDPTHVQIYSGNGTIIEAPHTDANVREVPMWGFWTARRITSTGTVST